MSLFHVVGGIKSRFVDRLAVASHRSPRSSAFARNARRFARPDLPPLDRPLPDFVSAVMCRRSGFMVSLSVNDIPNLFQKRIELLNDQAFVVITYQRRYNARSMLFVEYRCPHRGREKSTISIIEYPG